MPNGRAEDYASSLYDLNGHAVVKNSCPGCHEICNFFKPVLGHYYYELSLFYLCSRAEKNSKKYIYMYFTLFIPIVCPLWVGSGSWNLYGFPFPSRCYMYVPDLVKVGRVVPKKMLTHDEQILEIGPEWLR